MADYNDKNHLLHLDGTDSTAGPDVENEEQRDATPLAQDVAEGEGGLTAAMQSEKA